MTKQEAWRTFLRRINKEGRHAEFHSAWNAALVAGKYPSEEQAKWGTAQKYPPLALGVAHELHFTEAEDGRVSIAPSEGEVAPKGHGGARRKTVTYDPSLAKMADLIAAVDPTKEASGQEEMRWVYHNMLAPWRSITPESVPSLGALGYLRWARKNEKNTSKFYELWTKSLEKRGIADESERRTDYGQKPLSLMDKWEASLQPATVDGE